MWPAGVGQWAVLQVRLPYEEVHAEMRKEGNDGLAGGRAKHDDVAPLIGPEEGAMHSGMQIASQV